MRSSESLGVLTLSKSKQYHFHVIRFFKGGPLDNFMQKQESFSEERVQSIIFQVIKALTYMHEQNLLHRDLKSENVMVADSEEGEDIFIKLIDFGFAKMAKKGENLTEQLGTPYYIAPEIIANKKYDFKVDIWSLGVMTYELICGQYPFDD